MDHNDKRNNSVPLGTFEETEGAATDVNAVDGPPGPHDGREDTWPNFTTGSDRPRRRTRTLMGVPGLTGFEEPDSQPGAGVVMDSADRPTVPYPSREDISQAIAEVLDAQGRPSDSAAKPVQVERVDPEFDPEAQEVTTLYESDVVALSDSSPEARLRTTAAEGASLIEVAPPRESTIEVLSESDIEPVRDSELYALKPDEQRALRANKPDEPAAAASLPFDLNQTIPELPTEVTAEPPRLTDAMRSNLRDRSAEPITRREHAADGGGLGAGPSLQPTDFSSLAPREVARLRSAAPPPRDHSSRNGALLVAAVMLLATGAWFLTGGTFRRASMVEAPAPAAAPATAAVTQPSQASMEKPAEPAISKPAETTTAAATETAPQQEPSALATNLQGNAPGNAAPGSADAAATAPGKRSAAQPGPSPRAGKGLAATSRSLRVKPQPQKPGLVPPPPGSGEPEQPTRTEVIQRMESVRSSVRACAAGRSGVADLDITIAHTGAVMHVLVGGDFAGTTEGSCIARAVRTARFPSFKQDRFRLLFPYAI
jgi:hypothetical protein